MDRKRQYIITIYKYINPTVRYNSLTAETNCPLCILSTRVKPINLVLLANCLVNVWKSWWLLNIDFSLLISLTLDSRTLRFNSAFTTVSGCGGVKESTSITFWKSPCQPLKVSQPLNLHPNIILILPFQPDYNFKLIQSINQYYAFTYNLKGIESKITKVMEYLFDKWEETKVLYFPYFWNPVNMGHKYTSLWVDSAWIYIIQILWFMWPNIWFTSEAKSSKTIVYPLLNKYSDIFSHFTVITILLTTTSN